MDAVAAVVGAVVGAVIVLTGQIVVQRAERRESRRTLLFEQCAQVIALEEDFRNRVWEERKLGLNGRVGSWSLSDHRVAQARIKLLCSDLAVLSSMEAMHETGIELGKAWRLQASDDDLVQRTWEAHRLAIEEFATRSRQLFA